MRYAKHIGRVGGLAVALGVGFGFGPVHGLPTAYATEPGADSSSSDSSPASTDHSTGTTGSTGSGTQSSGAGSSTTGASGDESKDDTTDPPHGDIATNPKDSSTDDKGDAGEIGGNETETTG